MLGISVIVVERAAGVVVNVQSPTCSSSLVVGRAVGRWVVLLIVISCFAGWIVIGDGVQIVYSWITMKLPPNDRPSSSSRTVRPQHHPPTAPPYRCGLGVEYG